MATMYPGYWDEENRERWTLHYVEELSLRQSGTVLSWDSWRAFYRDLEGTKEWSDAEHSQRRTIAILDEEIELHKQSSFLVERVRHFNKTISTGCWYVVHNPLCLLSITITLWAFSVNKREFRRRYGF